jgi:hypothetical protein
LNHERSPCFEWAPSGALFCPDPRTGLPAGGLVLILLVGVRASSQDLPRRGQGDNSAAWTNEVGVTTPPAAPGAPTDLTLNVLSAMRIRLTWADNSSNETAFAVWRKIGAGDWERIAVVAPNTTSFSDITVSAGTAYTYRVRAIGLSSASTWTDEIGATTP